MNNLERHVLRLIGENVSSPDVFTDTSSGMAQVRDSLNDAIQELCMVTGHYRKKYHLSTYANRALYRLAPRLDFLGWVVEAWDRDNHRPLRQTDLTTLSQTEDWFLKRDGTPQWWYQMGWEHIGFFPRPGSEGQVLELNCIAIPKPYAHNTPPVTLRSQFERAAVYRAVSDYYASRGDARRAQEEFQRYLEIANLMALNPVGQERPARFRPGEGPT